MPTTTSEAATVRTQQTKTPTMAFMPAAGQRRHEPRIRAGGYRRTPRFVSTMWTMQPGR